MIGSRFTVHKPLCIIPTSSNFQNIQGNKVNTAVSSLRSIDRILNCCDFCHEMMMIYCVEHNGILTDQTYTENKNA